MDAPSAEPRPEHDHDAAASEPDRGPSAQSTIEPPAEPTIQPTIEPTNEPTNVGPAAGGSLRASDADRDQVAALLSAAYAEGRLTREEHDERLEQVIVAKT